MTQNLNDILPSRSEVAFSPGPMDSLVTRARGAGQLTKFPEDIESQKHWMMIRVFKDAQFRLKKATPDHSSLETIVLPMPATLGTGYGAEYKNSDLGLAGVAAATMATEGRGLGSTKSVGELLSGVLGKIRSESNQQFGRAAIAELTRGAAEAADFLIPGDVVGGFLGALNIAPNPHTAVLFQNVGLRSHQFQYKFIAKNKAESERLRKIIAIMKYYMLPDYSSSFGNFYFNYPNKFQIDFHYPKYLFSIAPSVLTSFAVNYHAEGVPLYFGAEDGGLGEQQPAPFSVELDMTFQEVTIQTKQTVKDYNR